MKTSMAIKNDSSEMKEIIKLNGKVIMRGNENLAMIFFSLTGRNFEGEISAHERYLERMKGQFQVAEWVGDLTFESPTENYFHSFVGKENTMKEQVYHADFQSGLSYTNGALNVKDFVEGAKSFFEQHGDTNEVNELECGEAVIHTINELGENVKRVHYPH